MVVGSNVKFGIRYLTLKGVVCSDSEFFLQYQSGWDVPWQCNGSPTCYVVPVLLVGEDIVIDNGDGKTVGSAFEMCMPESV